jgi:hypothetical protein
MMNFLAGHGPDGDSSAALNKGIVRDAIARYLSLFGYN